MNTSSAPLSFALLSALLATALSACAAPSGSAQPQPAKPADSAALWQQIQVEIGDAPCDGPLQCRSIAVGAKPCGGPDAYLAWSTQRNGDGATLKRLVAAYAIARAQDNQRSGMASNCAMVTDPGASCQAGRCQLQPPGFGRQPGRAD